MILRIKKIAGKHNGHINTGFEIEGTLDMEVEVGKRISLSPRIVASDGAHYQYFYTSKVLRLSDAWPKVGTEIYTENSTWQITFINRD